MSNPCDTVYSCSRTIDLNKCTGMVKMEKWNFSFFNFVILYDHLEFLICLKFKTMEQTITVLYFYLLFQVWVYMEYISFTLDYFRLL